MSAKKPEVLSPVGSPESLQAAVRSGADAVYIGAKQFSARRNADNFNNSDLEDAVRYCHIRGVKVYLALNVMLKQSELADAFDLAKFADSIGIDGIIVQDLGLASLIQNYLPDIELHASTQMSVHSPAALPFLKKMGFSRVVAAREMSRKALKEFCDRANELGMEVEVFVHGALCMSVSGQCLLSSVLGARSGNRGLCAGPCRLPFKVKGGTGYDLSLKDLSLYEHIGELKNMGVASLKIEGRMKRPEYIAAATAVCRSAVDNGYVDDSLSKYLKGVFSRSGFTDGYFTDNRSTEMFGIRTKDDVICAKDTFADIHGLYRTERQSVPVDINVCICASKPIVLTINDGTYKITVTGDIPQTAKNKAVDCEYVTGALTKLGNTPYYINSCDVVLDEGLFIPSSTLNSMRRDAVERLNEARMTVAMHRSFTPRYETDDCFHGGNKIVARFSSADQIPSNLKNADAVILPLECDFSAIPDGVRKIADLPRFITNETAVLKQLAIAKSNGVTSAYCGNLSAVELARKADLEIMGAVGLNVCNSESIRVLNEMGVGELLLSAEISLSDAVKMTSAIPKGIFAYGKMPLMLLRNCPVKNGISCEECQKNGFITDRKNIKFPIMCRAGYSELLNSKPLYLADRLNEIRNIDFIMLYFTDESPDTCERIIDEYISGGKPSYEYTRNLYYRNLL